MTWTAPELVCRAVRMILDGALDDAGEAELGARLGVSSRHLRRLFTAHLGVTPDGLARSARVHFARRLLDDTDLTVTEIAFAAGFGSLRQFNRACREIFREAPRELRKRRRKADRLVADGGLVLRLPFHGPLDWSALTAYFAARAVPGVEAVSGDTYRRTVVIDGDPGVIELLPGAACDGGKAAVARPENRGRLRRPLGGDDHLLLRAHLPHWDELVHVVQRARRIPSLDFHMEAATSALAHDRTLAPLLRARPGVRPPGTWDAFETGVRAIVGQQVTVSGANTLTSRIVEQFGTEVAGLAALGLTHTFPTAAKLADADLSEVGLVPARAAAVCAFARAVAEDTIRLDGSIPLDEMVASLTSIDGIGPWTAHYLALRLGEADAFPATDLGLRRALPAHAPSLGELAERWRPWRALAATHLWLADGTQAARRPARGAA
jgi:AraC family transcriptional regulator of adaptative response / DNA-3-methyladenine glycosylase II